MVEGSNLDGTDWEILQLLSEDARLPTTTIARKLGISREVAKNRMKQLSMQGVIKSFLVYPDAAKLGYPLWGYMHIRFKDITAKREKELIEFARQEPLVPFAYSNMGSWDFGVEFMARDPRHFYELQRRFMDKFSDIIKDYETGSFMDVYKMNYVPQGRILKAKAQPHP
jgi:DNA-binding Lrp family transcriptional regulator